MLSALAPSGPVAPVVPTSPPSTADTAQPVQRESFKDVYSNVPNDDCSQNDGGSKPKASSSNDIKAKKSSTDDSNGKAVVTAIPAPHGLMLQKAPLVFALPAFGPEIPVQPKSDELSNPTGDQSTTQSPAQSGGTEALSGSTPGVLVPSFSLPIAKPEQIAASALAPANEKLAFSARLTQPDAPAAQTQTFRFATPQPKQAQTSESSKDNVEPISASAAKDERPTSEGNNKAATLEAVLPAHEAASGSTLDLRQMPLQPQPAEPNPAPAARSLSIQDVQPVTLEAPKAPATTQILLQLAGQDQSTASVRVVDRMGTVNVTVHAADADLRSSLRSNLSDLASQLTGQGYKTELVKPAVIAANTSNQQDSRHTGRDGSGQQQQQFTPDGRQPQRDRRANSELWRNELEQETSGTPGATGGNS